MSIRNKNILEFPHELKEMFWSYCSGEDLMNFACTCRRSYNTVKHLLWKKLHIPWALLHKKADFVDKKSHAPKHLDRLFNTVEMSFHHEVELVKPLKWGYVCKKFRKVLSLCDAKKVRKLSFSRLIDTRGILYVCQKLKHLQQLHFHALKYTHPKAWEQVALLPLLTSLVVQCCPIDDQGVAHIATTKSIRELKLVGCKNLTEESIFHITKLQAQLKCLTLSDNKAFGPNIERIGTMRNLVHLDLSGTLIRNKGVCSIVGRLSGSLEHFSLNGCVLITERVLVYLDRLERLQTLEVRGTVFSEKSLREFSEMMGMGLKGGVVSVAEE